MEIYPVLDELASSINTLILERVRRLKGYLLALTRRVQKVCLQPRVVPVQEGLFPNLHFPHLEVRKKKGEAGYLI